MFMMLSLFGHMWSIYLHNYECHVMPGWIYDSYDHNVHHHYGQNNYNFSLYFEVWDRVFGTYRDKVPTSSRIQDHKYKPSKPANDRASRSGAAPLGETTTGLQATTVKGKIN